MEKENLKKLFTYSLFSKETETYDIIVVGYDDKETIDYYLNSFKDILSSLSKYYKGDKLDLEISNFKDKIKNSCIYQLGYFDNFKGEFINDKKMLVDLFDYEFNESEENKDNV